MIEEIRKALEITGIKSTYLKREKGIFPTIVYVFNEFSSASGDNKEENSKYDIYINLYTVDKVSANTKLVKDALAAAGFVKEIINTPKILEIDNIECYQIIFNYKKIK